MVDRSYEKLEKEYAKPTAKLKQYQHKGQRYENRIHYYAEGERKKRNHRLIPRGADVKRMAPEVRGMSQAERRTVRCHVRCLPRWRDFTEQATS